MCELYGGTSQKILGEIIKGCYFLSLADIEAIMKEERRGLFKYI